MADVTGPSDERINYMRNLGARARAGDTLAQMQLEDAQAHPFESAESILGNGANITSMKPERTMSLEEAQAETANRAQVRNTPAKETPNES
jgi:hypothetical protein